MMKESKTDSDEVLEALKAQEVELGNPDLYGANSDGTFTKNGEPVKATINLEPSTYWLIFVGTMAAVLTAVTSIFSSIATWKQAEIAEKTLNQIKSDNHNTQNIKSDNVNNAVNPIVNSVNDNSIRNSSPTNAPSPKTKCKHKK